MAKASIQDRADERLGQIQEEIDDCYLSREYKYSKWIIQSYSLFVGHSQAINDGGIIHENFYEKA